MDGILIIDKPEGMTSHDVVQAIRKKFSISKAGHLGTLDPMATGVLPVCVGKATRIARFVAGSPKEYEGEIRFGFATDTYDRDGTAAAEEKPLKSTREEIEAAMQSLTGLLDQVPPPFSAKKIGGVPAYKLARKNRPIEMAPSPVEVERFQMLRFNPPLMNFRVVCSPGTYIRSLAHCLGQRIGCGAHLAALRRTRSGDFGIEHSVKLECASATDLIPLNGLLTSMPCVEVSGPEETKVRHGNPIQAAASAGEFTRIFNKKGEFIAVASLEKGWAHPRLVLTSITSD